MGKLKEANEEDNKMLAAQLREPRGEIGVEVGKVMNQTNESMINETIDSLRLHMNDVILEIGHGNGRHVKDLMEVASNMLYFGLDISDLMHREAKLYCDEIGLSNCAEFVLYNGLIIPFPKNKFQKVFTVNTLYFWEKPVLFLNEIHRVLAPGGTLSIAFVTKKAMAELAFTNYGFNKYNQEDFHSLIQQSEFNEYALTQYTEEIEGKLGDGIVNREYFIAQLTKK
ncbi:MAG: class I SAM-dependent methyltransferase [Salibacteraceae bacterium]